MTWLRQFAGNVDPRKRSELFRQGLRNASWNTLDYIALPLLFLAVTPFLIFRLGTDQFGIWMLVNALTGVLGVMHFGLGDATVKYTSAYRAQADWGSVVRVIRSTQTVYGLLGLLSAAVIYLGSPVLVHHAFKIEPAHRLLAVSAIRIGAIGLAVRFLNSVYTSALQGFERFDLSARVTIVVKIATIGGIIAVIALGRGLLAVLWVSVICSAIGTIVLALVVKHLVPTIRFSPLFDRESLREIFGFGFYTWLQAIAGTVFAQADLLLVGVLLGTGAVAYYSVCQRVAIQIQAVLGAGSAFLFPMSSTATERGDLDRMRDIYARSVSLIAVLSVALGVPIFLFSKSLLTHWLGPDFALHASALLKILVFGYALLATSIVPYNVLNGTGHVRANTALSWSSVVVVVGGIFALVPTWGLAGVAWAKILNIGPLVAAMAYIQRRVLKERSWRAIVAPFASTLALFAAAFLFANVCGNLHLTSLVTLAAMAVLSMVLAAGLGLAVQRAFRVKALLF